MTSYLSSCKLSLVCVEVPLKGLVPFFVGVLLAWFLALQGLDGSMPCMTTTGLCPWSTLVYHSPPWAGHILSRIYNCTKHGNWPLDNATTARFTLHISILQLHKL